MNSSRVDLMQVLVDVGEAFEVVNSRTVRETEQRADLEAAPRLGVAITLLVLQHGGLAEDELRAMTNQPLQQVRKAAASLARQGIIQETVDRGERRYEPTARAMEVRELARERSTKSIRYALAHLTETQVRDLEAALGALTALSHGLGQRDIGDS
jgi:hypothetical protein